jgi:hypothetical protein
MSKYFNNGESVRSSDFLSLIGATVQHEGNTVKLNFELWNRASVAKKLHLWRLLELFPNKKIIFQGGEWISKPACLNEAEMFEADLLSRDPERKNCECGKCKDFAFAPQRWKQKEANHEIL